MKRSRVHSSNRSKKRQNKSFYNRMFSRRVEPRHCALEVETLERRVLLTLGGITAQIVADGIEEVWNSTSADETLEGGVGDDRYVFVNDWGVDTVVENANEGNDTLDFSQVTKDLSFTIHSDGTVSVTDGENTISNAAHIENLIGGTGSDTFVLNRVVCLGAGSTVQRVG